MLLANLIGVTDAGESGMTTCESVSVTSVVSGDETTRCSVDSKGGMLNVGLGVDGGASS